MVVHKETIQKKHEPLYWVGAKLCEPDYEAEFKYVRMELAFVDRKLAERSPRVLRQLSLPSLGFFRREDWRKYQQKLERYAEELEDYAHEVTDGVVPVKFAVYNEGNAPDRAVAVRVRVENGRFDMTKKAPQRPDRLDAAGHTGMKLSWPALPQGFSRSEVKLSGHAVAAQLSALGAHDGAMLVNKLVHVHCEEDTEVTYEVHSHNVHMETGDVEF